jgi:hypothetical protein
MEVIVTGVVMEGYDWKSLSDISNDEFCYEMGQNFRLLRSQCLLCKTIQEKCALH